MAMKRPVSAVLLPISLFLGCTGSDVLHTGSTAVTVRTESVNSTTRFSDPGDFATLKIQQITVVPVDPVTSQVLSTPIGLFANAKIEINFNTGTSTPVNTRLSVGTWRIVSIELGDYLFCDQSVCLGQPLPPAASCQDLAAYDAFRPGFVNPAILADFNPPLILNILSESDEIVLRIDVEQLILAIGTATDCDPASGTVFSFNTQSLTDQLPTYLTIQ